MQENLPLRVLLVHNIRSDVAILGLIWKGAWAYNNIYKDNVEGYIPEDPILRCGIEHVRARSSAREEGAHMWEVGGAYRRPGAARRHLTFLPSEVLHFQRPYVPIMLFPNGQYLNRLSADPVKMNHSLKHCFLSYCIHHLNP